MTCSKRCAYEPTIWIVDTSMLYTELRPWYSGGG